MFSTSNASGALVARQTYFPYGAVRATSGTLPTDYTFTGQKADASSGLMYYAARYYDAALGRFTQPDTIVPDQYNPQALNRYSYVYNNPLKYTDPSGHCPLGVAAMAYAKIIIINAAVDTAIDFGIAQLTGEQFSLGHSLVTNLAIDTVTAGVGGKITKSGKIAGLVAKYGDEVLGVVKHAAPPLENAVLRKLGRELVKDLPEQTHHILTITHESKWTPIFEKFVEKYGLDLKGVWNQIDIPHQGKHAEDYHKWVWETLQRIDKKAQGDVELFLELFDKEIKEKVLDNPWIVRGDWWHAIPGME